MPLPKPEARIRRQGGAGREVRYLEIIVAQQPMVVLEVFYDVTAKLLDEAGRDDEGDFLPASVGADVAPNSANLMVAADDWSHDLALVRDYDDWQDVPGSLMALERQVRPSAADLGISDDDLAEELREREE